MTMETKPTILDCGHAPSPVSTLRTQTIVRYAPFWSSAVCSVASCDNEPYFTIGESEDRACFAHVGEVALRVITAVLS